MPHTKIISVMDREADFFELFEERNALDPTIDLLVRAKHDRALGTKDKLFKTCRQSPVLAKKRVFIPRQSSRAKKSKQKAREERPARWAILELRIQNVVIQPSSYLKDKDPIRLQAVHLYESHPPAGQERVEWFLLTTLPVETADAGWQCVAWYSLRWRIEDWHRILKSGCGIEKFQHKTAERLKRAIAINLVVAWRIMLLTLLGREAPNLPAETLFTKLELEVLRADAQKKTIAAPKRSGKR